MAWTRAVVMAGTRTGSRKMGWVVPWFLGIEFKDYGLCVLDCMLLLLFFFVRLCGLVWHHVKVGLRHRVSYL